MLPKSLNNFELVFHFFGYADDTEATELVQRGTARDGEKTSVIEMSHAAPDQQATLTTESLIRKLWVGYQKLMDFGDRELEAARP